MMARWYLSATFVAAFFMALLLTGCSGDPTAPDRRAGVDLDNPDQDQTRWVEDTPPPPPAYDAGHLISITMPPSSSIKMGIDPKTITIDRVSGVVRYVVVARGPAAINAMYEGIRCSTDEFRVYARQVKGQPWEQADDSGWRSMSGQSGILVQHPLELAQGGICDGPTMTATVHQMEQLLRSSDLRPDLYRY